MKKLKRILVFLVLIVAVSISGLAAIKAEAADSQVRYDVKFGQTEARTMLKMINDFRTGDEAWYWQSDNATKYVATNLKAVVYDYDLEKIAMQRAAEIAAAFSHTRPDGTSCFTCTSNGVSSYGENIAAGTALNTAEKAFVLWQETDENYAGQGHRRNMLKDGFTAVGIGYANVGGCHFWVQEFSYYKKTVTATEAIDTTQSVNVTIAEEQISSKTLEVAEDSLAMKEGESINIPEVTLSLKLKETWPSYRKISSAVSVNWKSGDSTIIRISDGKIYGLKQGKTTLSAETNGMTVSVEVEVEHVAGDEIKEAVVEPTCAVPGSYDMAVYCTKCGEELSRKTITVAALGHTMVVDKSISATCEKTGLTEGSHCSVCNEVIKAQEETIALGHAYGEWKTVKKATCTEKGSHSKECSRCGEVQTQEVEALGHVEVTDTAKDATCTEAGLTEGKHCARCNEVLVKQETVNALGHVYGEWKLIKEATCTEKGSQSKECSRCKNLYIEEIEEAAHTVVIDEAKEATCTEDGLTEGSHCSVCQKKLVEQQIVPAHGHIWDEGIVVQEESCTSQGIKNHVCTKCDATKKEISTELGHDYSTKWMVDKKATMSSNGSKSKHCTRCDEKTSVTTIYKASTVKLSTAIFVYNGKMRSPGIVVKDSKGNTIGTANYTVTKPSGRKNVGKYTYKITFKNQYSGTKSLKLTINPKGTSISSLTKGSKAFTVKWKKQSAKMAASRITGYQIQYAANKKFTNPKSKLVTGYNSTSKKITGLKADTTYYVRVRTYKTVKIDGKSVKLYSGWSSAKKVKIPK